MSSTTTRKVDPITLAVIRGALETTQREMSLTLEKTAVMVCSKLQEISLH